LGSTKQDGSWGHDEEEILLADVGTTSIQDQKPPAWKKIRQACQTALKNGLDYVWVDTCCINKDSSAELEESINAMFTSYEQSALCLAYLADLQGPLDSEPGKQEEQLQGCRWMKRGWTLQELMAPKRLIFTINIGTRLDLGVILPARFKESPELMARLCWVQSPVLVFTVARKMN
jgi:hypothetical protein